MQWSKAAERVQVVTTAERPAAARARPRLTASKWAPSWRARENWCPNAAEVVLSSKIPRSFFLQALRTLARSVAERPAVASRAF